MKARLNARFASARETGEILGVPTSRVESLLELANSDPVVQFKKARNAWNGTKTRRRATKAGSWSVDFSSRSNGKPDSHERKKARKSQASRKGRARGKSSNATR